MSETPIEKRPFPFTLAALCVLLGAVGSGVYLYAGDRGQIYQNAKDIVELQQETLAFRGDSQATKMELIELKSDVRHIKEGVDELRRREDK